MSSRFNHDSAPLDFPISEELIDHIAERAAEKAVKKMTDEAYKTIGKSVLDKLFWIVGVLSVAAYFWVKTNGWVKP